MKDCSVSIEYMMGLINSKLFQYLMYKINFENTQGAFTKAKIYHYNQLPVIIPDKDVEDRISNLVVTILEKNGEGTTEEEKIIDNLIYRIYELTDEEIKQVEGDYGRY